MPKWTLEQELAINESGKNIIVSAGAGSGKTAVLTERVIRKLKSGISINQLLILTFTNNAAHEMKERIRKAIKKECIQDQSFKRELDYIDNAYITTFDSYAHSIVKKYHYLLNIGKDISIIDSNIIDLEKNKIIDDIFEKLYKNKDENFLNLVKLLCIKDDFELKNMIIKINDNLDLLADKKSYINNYINSYYNQEFISNEFFEYENLIVDKVEIINKLLDQLSSEVDGKYLDLYYSELESLLNSKDYDTIRNNLNIKLSPLRNTTELGKSIKKNITDIIKDLNNMCYYTKDELINSVNNTKDYVEVILDIINDLDDRIKSYKNKLNMYEFNDISIMAIDIVRNNKNVRNELKNSYMEICIDEYQDTSDLQETFINLISNNNVYCVGDIKQSIYRFRNANPMLFKTKYDNYSKNINGMKIDLVKNFRSRNEVLDNINEIFNLIMDNIIGGAEYSESHNMVFGNTTYINEGKINQNNNLEIYNYESDKKSIYKNEEIEAFIIANDIKNKIDNSYKIFDKDTLTIRNICYDDFVILMDRSSSFDLYKKILESNSIPTTLFKDENIIDEDEILIIKNIISLIIKIKDNKVDDEFKYYFTSIARSYLCEYTDNVIFSCFLHNDFINNIIYTKCKDISINLDNMSCVELLNNVVKSFDIFNNFINVGNIEVRTMIINYLYETFSNLDSIGYSVYNLSDYLNELIGNNKQIKVNMNTNNSNSVKIMTIHKSKGLEYHVCYFSGFDKNFNLSDIKTRIVYDDKYGIIVPYYNEGLNDLFIKYLIKNKYLLDDISERIRLLYVALTRVKEKMIIVGSFKDDDNILEDNGVVNNYVRRSYTSFNSIISSIKKRLQKYVKNIDINTIKLNKDYNSIKLFNYKDSINKSDLSIKVNSINIENNIKENKHFSKNNKSVIDKNIYNNIKLGTYLHELFESIDFKNIDIENIDEDNKKYAINFINQNILSNINNAKIYKEYEFIYENENILYHGIIDLMLEYEEYIDIIDYKLMNTTSEDYINQLNGYKTYIESTFNKKVNLYLYSIINNDVIIL